MIKIFTSSFIVLALLLSACTANRQRYDSSEEFTLGNVQKKITYGMSQAEVATVLGSPNIVTKDKDGNESWIYDKIGSEVTYSNEGGGVWLIIAGYSGSSGRVKTSQKTLTVVIKFDKNSEVQNVSYHASKF